MQLSWSVTDPTLQYHLTQDYQGGLIQNEIICLRSYSMRTVLTGHICG